MTTEDNSVNWDNITISLPEPPNYSKEIKEAAEAFLIRAFNECNVGQQFGEGVVVPYGLIDAAMHIICGTVWTREDD